MLPVATVPRGGNGGRCSVVVAAADSRSSLESLSSCSNGCEIQGSGLWESMLGLTRYLVKSLRSKCFVLIYTYSSGGPTQEVVQKMFLMGRGSDF